MHPSKESFRKNLDGKETMLHILENGKGMVAAVTNYGARLVSIIVNDSKGKPTDVVAGFSSIDGYLASTETYYGAVVGRYANRIAGGRFTLGGKEYRLAINNPPNHLHGGPGGFHKQVWDVTEATADRIRLSYFSANGEENYPGNLKVSVSYSLSGNNELVIDYEGTTDAPTIINLTSHAFFNLNGEGSGTIGDHLLMINADRYTPVDATLIPSTVEGVGNTPFDFRMPVKIFERIGQDHPQLAYGAGYDHNYVLNGEGLRSVAMAMGDRSGITMEVLTDQPGMQFYTCNHTKGENRLKNGMPDHRREAFCLETQHFPDSPNQPQFPSTLLVPGERYRSRTIYGFGTQG